MEAHNFQRDLAKYEQEGAVVLGVSVDTAQSHKDFCAKEGLNFKLLADPDAKVSTEYGSVMDYQGSKLAARNTFIINPYAKPDHVRLSAKKPTRERCGGTVTLLFLINHHSIPVHPLCSPLLVRYLSPLHCHRHTGSSASSGLHPVPCVRGSALCTRASQHAGVAPTDHVDAQRRSRLGPAASSGARGTPCENIAQFSLSRQYILL